MESTCNYVFVRGSSKGKYCWKPVIFGEKYCMLCIFREHNLNEVSDQFRSLIEKFKLTRYIDKFLSTSYGFVLKYDGQLHLVGMINEDEEDRFSQERLRRPTMKEVKLAINLGINVDDKDNIVKLLSNAAVIDYKVTNTINDDSMLYMNIALNTTAGEFIFKKVEMVHESEAASLIQLIFNSEFIKFMKAKLIEHNGEWEHHK